VRCALSGSLIASRGGMHTRLAWVGFLFLSACTSMQARVPQPPLASMPAATPLAAAEAPSSPAGRVRGEASADRPASLACLDARAIDEWERRHRTRTQEWAPQLFGPTRGGRHLGEVEAIVRDEGMPTWLALIPTFESGFDTRALGPTGTRGIWQLKATTARRYGLTVGRERDDRLQVQLATRAAMRYLRYLYKRYGDWPLAIAAYNAGEGRVDRALRLNPGANFWDLSSRGSLPPITCAYVPKLLGLIRVTGHEPCGALGYGAP